MRYGSALDIDVIRYLYNLNIWVLTPYYIKNFGVYMEFIQI